MSVNHRITRLLVAFTVGIISAWFAYQWGTDTQRSERRAEEEAIVLAARQILLSYVEEENVEVSDALQRNKEAGKVYIYPTDTGWELSGHYRRSAETVWHDYLLILDADGALLQLSVNDNDLRLVARAAIDPRFNATR